MKKIRSSSRPVLKNEQRKRTNEREKCPPSSHLLSILRTASSMKTLESAPDHSGSLSGKIWPISGNPRAPEKQKNKNKTITRLNGA